MALKMSGPKTMAGTGVAARVSTGPLHGPWMSG